jgi:hypothetical protein
MTPVDRWRSTRTSGGSTSRFGKTEGDGTVGTTVGIGGIGVAVGTGDGGG